MAPGADGPDGQTENRSTHHRWIWFITGPTACGKTTVAKALAEELGMAFLEGDDFHPQSNIDKMSRGEPLTDADRWDWLHTLRDRELARPPPGRPPGTGLVVTCSALKREYRDVLREGSAVSPALRVRFVFLSAPEPVLARRAAERKGHYAGSRLVHSQFVDLERPAPDEGDVLLVDVDRPPEEVRREVRGRVRGAMKEDGSSGC